MAKKNSLPVSLKNIHAREIRYLFHAYINGISTFYEVIFFGYADEKWKYQILRWMDKISTQKILKIGTERYPGLQVAKGILINYLNNK